MRIRPDARWGDAALAVVLLGIGLATALTPGAAAGAGGTWLDALTYPAVLAPLLLRRRSPPLAAAAFPAAVLVSAVPTFAQLRIPAVVAVGMVVAFALGQHVPWRMAAAGLVLLAVGFLVDGLTEHVLDSPVPMLVFAVPLGAAAFGAGRLVRSRDRLAEELRATTRELERRRDETASLAIELERARLASDLDAAARRRIREIVDAAAVDEGDFGRIESAARASLNEMRELLGVMRSDGGGRHAPGPRLADIDALLADMRRGGRSVGLSVEGDHRELPGDVELAAYRTLQHALAALDGRDGAAASVVLRYLPDALEVEVQGPAAEGAGAQAALAAAHERIRVQGGRLDARGAGPRRVLTARLPVVPAHA
ncbi:MAG: hypothetical protein U0237_13340 [Thermoleophilia bacterium]